MGGEGGRRGGVVKRRMENYGEEAQADRGGYRQPPGLRWCAARKRQGHTFASIHGTLRLFFRPPVAACVGTAAVERCVRYVQEVV